MPKEQFLINPYTENDIYPPYNEKRFVVQHCLVSQQSLININPSSTDNLDILVTGVINSIVLLFLVIRLQRKNNHCVSTCLLEKSKILRQFHWHLGASHNCWLSSCSCSTVTWKSACFYEQLSHIPKNGTRRNRNS